MTLVEFVLAVIGLFGVYKVASGLEDIACAVREIAETLEGFE